MIKKSDSAEKRATIFATQATKQKWSQTQVNLAWKHGRQTNDDDDDELPNLMPYVS